jgi:hypothetical protein
MGLSFRLPAVMRSYVGRDIASGVPIGRISEAAADGRGERRKMRAGAGAIVSRAQS